MTSGLKPNYRNAYFKIKDDIFGITLKSENKDIPGWKKVDLY